MTSLQCVAVLVDLVARVVRMCEHEGQREALQTPATMAQHLGLLARVVQEAPHLSSFTEEVRRMLNQRIAVKTASPSNPVTYVHPICVALPTYARVSISPHQPPAYLSPASFHPVPPRPAYRPAGPLPLLPGP